MNTKAQSVTGEIFTGVMLGLLVLFIGVIIMFVFNPFGVVTFADMKEAVLNVFGL